MKIKKFINLKKIFDLRKSFGIIIALIAVIFPSYSSEATYSKPTNSQSKIISTDYLEKSETQEYILGSGDLVQIRSIIRPVGLSPMKSKGIHGLSKILIKKYKGNVPKDLEALESLPAVGHKTASVVMSQAFGVPSFPVDTHIHRLMYRWGLTSGKNVVQTEKDAKRLFPTKLWNKLHLQIIFYGRERSPARAWNINNDPITQKIGRKSILKKLVNS